MARFRIMVVDDDADVRFVVSSLLGLEFETTQALNGLDALEKIERYEPDLQIGRASCRERVYCEV